jgi:small subunit ribosomal protein S1
LYNILVILIVMLGRAEMLSRRIYRKAENDESLDEGWWTSILSDEEANISSTRGGSDFEQPSLNGVVDWGLIQSIYARDEIIVLKVYGYNRGGILVHGPSIQGFVPISHLVDMPGNIFEDDRYRILTNYIGRSLHLKIIECEPSQERVVFSERAALAGEGKRKQLFKILRESEAVHGIVTNVTDFGVFIDLGGVEGLIHVSELSWGRVHHPREVLKVGQEVRALVLQVSEEGARVALSLKRLYPNPWDSLESRYELGDVVPAVITDVQKFGAFAKVEDGVEGLIHISSFKQSTVINDLSQLIFTGQPVHVRILHIDISRRRLGLSLVNVE